MSSLVAMYIRLFANDCRRIGERRGCDHSCPVVDRLVVMVLTAVVAATQAVHHGLERVDVRVVGVCDWNWRGSLFTDDRRRLTGQRSSCADHADDVGVGTAVNRGARRVDGLQVVGRCRSASRSDQ